MDEQEKKSKKLYQRWWVWVIGVILIVFAWNRISMTIDKATNKEIPNVMSINYTEAETVLKENGFKVTAVEADASSVLANIASNNRSVKKGEVFKINNSISPTYYEITKDKKVTIYYAKDDYVYEKPVEETSQPATDSAQTENTDASTASTEAWKQFLKDYEAWTDKYIEFMKKYKANPTDITLISEYGKFAAETVEWAEKAKKYENELNQGNVSPEIIQEYFDTLARITKKITEVAN